MVSVSGPQPVSSFRQPSNAFSASGSYTAPSEDSRGAVNADQSSSHEVAGNNPIAPSNAQNLMPSIYCNNPVPNIVDQSGGAVVSIHIFKRESIDKELDELEQLTGEKNQKLREMMKGKFIPEKIGEGSGFIIVIDGKKYVLTNAHVVNEKGVDEIKIILRDGRSFSGKIVGLDTTLDIAVLNIVADNSEQDFPALQLGDSSKIRTGEGAIAIGNPFGLDNSVTVGVISNRGREVEGKEGKHKLIQTDAPINPGNSGGPLINFEGEVIGINVEILDGAQSIGFAIPINSVKEITNELISNGKVARACLGIRETINFGGIDDLVSGAKQGVVIIVSKKGPAKKAGLKSYDIVYEVNGNMVENETYLQETIKKMKPGDTLELKVLRKSEKTAGQIDQLSFKVKLVQKPNKYSGF